LISIEAHLRDSREFFGPRAATWDQRFPDDEPAYADAVVALRPPSGGTVVDLGCGTGRALPFLRDAVGAAGLVVGVDATPEMLRAARDHRRDDHAPLVLADVTRLPFAPRRVDGFFAAGIVPHAPDPAALLELLARAGRPGCRLAIFHPVGRAALARRHHRELQPDELLDPRVLPGVLAASGWAPESVDDADHRYLALATLAP
jgi:SAM-dependent methyltransferase